MVSIKSFIQKISIWNRARLQNRNRGNYPYSLAVLGIMKNEAMNIDEWVSHYIAVGADKIFLIDNGSTDETIQKAKAWVKTGKVALIELPKPHRQRQHYWTAIKHFQIRKLYRWLLLVDLDEFWFCQDNSSLTQKLAENEDLQLIYANWRMFGSSGLVKHPTSIREACIHQDPNLASHQFRKFMCKTKILRYRSQLKIHSIGGANSRKTVSDNHNFSLNHYPIQSREFFESAKMQRGDVNSLKHSNTRDWAYFDLYDAPCTQENRLLSDLVKSNRLGRGRQD